MDILASGTAHQLYPTEIFFALLAASPNDFVEIPKMYPFDFGWGISGETSFPINTEHAIPVRLDMVYLSLCEKKFYSIESDIEKTKTIPAWESGLYDTFLVGMAPFGGIAIWLSGIKKTYLVHWGHGVQVNVDFAIYCPNNPHGSLDNLCDEQINNNKLVKENLEKNGLPPLDLFDKYMQQFTYRYVVRFAHWDEENEDWKDYTEDEILPNLDYIEESLFDGTHDKLHDGGLMQYHQAGKPKKLALQWTIKKSDYVAYLWFDDNTVRAAYETFYTQYPNAKMDFIFCIDVEKQKYQVSFNCEEAEMPMLLSEDAYQMIIFKSKFEYYRTPNYNQPRGAWVW